MIQGTDAASIHAALQAVCRSDRAVTPSQRQPRSALPPCVSLFSERERLQTVLASYCAHRQTRAVHVLVPGTLTAPYRIPALALCSITERRNSHKQGGQPPIEGLFQSESDVQENSYYTNRRLRQVAGRRGHRPHRPTGLIEQTEVCPGRSQPRANPEAPYHFQSRRLSPRASGRGDERKTAPRGDSGTTAMLPSGEAQQSAPSEKRTCGGPARYSNPSGPSVGMRGCQREIRPMPREIVALYVVDYLMAAARALMCRARCTRVQE